MSTINLTDFKQNISSYFDELISKKEPIFISRRPHSAMVLPLDGLSQDDIKIITQIRNNCNTQATLVKNKEWVATFNKIS